MAATLSADLDAACDGLVYISETDAPVRPFFRERGTAGGSATAQEKLESETAMACRRTDVDEFFGRLIRTEEWHTPAQRLNAEKFRLLKDLLVSRLSDLGVYKCGTIRVKIFVVGNDRDGNIAGIETEAVET